MLVWEHSVASSWLDLLLMSVLRARASHTNMQSCGAVTVNHSLLMVQGALCWSV
jgi:hypothetical protein